MPPKKPALPPANVARLTPDEQISYLFHQYEGFADWRISVDEKLEKVDALYAKVEALTSDQRETGLGVREILLFLRGQQTPGLERPGLSDDFKSHATKIADLEKGQAANDAFRARVGYMVAGATGTGILAAWRWWPAISKLLALLNASS